MGTRVRAHSGYFEVERVVRDAPLAVEKIVPGEANSWMNGELCCARSAANLQGEISSLAASRGLHGDAAVQATVDEDRNCGSFTPYVPGLDPRQHILEANARALEEDRKNFYRQMASLEENQAKRTDAQNRRLTLTAIIVTVAIGLFQCLLAIAGLVPETPGCALLKKIGGWPSQICSEKESANGR